MTIAEMFGQSAILTLIGMATVFLFLIVLVVCMSMMAKIVKALRWDKDLYQAPEEPGSDGTEAEVAAAIAIAVHEHHNGGA